MAFDQPMVKIDAFVQKTSEKNLICFKRRPRIGKSSAAKSCWKNYKMQEIAGSCTVESTNKLARKKTALSGKLTIKLFVVKLL